MTELPRHHLAAKQEHAQLAIVLDLRAHPALVHQIAALQILVNGLRRLLSSRTSIAIATRYKTFL